MTTRRLRRLFDAGNVVEFVPRCDARTKKRCTCGFARDDTRAAWSALTPTVSIYVHRFAPTQHYDYKEKVLREARNHNYNAQPLRAVIYKNALAPHALMSLMVPSETALRVAVRVSSDMFWSTMAS